MGRGLHHCCAGGDCVHQPWAVVVNTLSDWIENKQLIRRLAFVWVAALTTYTLIWSTGFASASPRPGMEVAAILGAVWGPLTLLQGYVFNAYNAARSDYTTVTTATSTTKVKDAP